MVSIKEFSIDQVIGWDNKLRFAEREAGFCQSECWARIIQKVDHATPIFLEVYNDDKLTSSLLMFHKIPWDRHKQKIKRGIYEFLSGSHKGWLVWLDGPVFHTDIKPEVLESLDAILLWAERFFLNNQLFRVVSLGFPPASRWANDSDVANLFLKYGYISKQAATYLVNLRNDEDKIWHNLKHAARKSTNKAQKVGLIITKIKSLDQFKEMYYLPYASMEASFGRSVNPWKTEQIQWEENREHLYHYYVAQTPNGEILATLGMYIFNNTATEIASSISKKAFIEKIPAQDLLHWHMMLEAKSLGCHTFNLAGINPHPSNSKEVGIKRFKEKWGGVYTEYLVHERALPGIRSKAIHVLENIYRKIRNG